MHVRRTIETGSWCWPPGWRAKGRPTSQSRPSAGTADLSDAAGGEPFGRRPTIVLVVSQFTLAAMSARAAGQRSTRQPQWQKSGASTVGNRLREAGPVRRVFQRTWMSAVNDGPVTILLGQIEQFEGPAYAIEFATLLVCVGRGRSRSVAPLVTET